MLSARLKINKIKKICLLNETQYSAIFVLTISKLTQSGRFSDAGSAD